MANMVGVAQNAAAAALYHQGYPMFGGAGPAASSPWMAAAMANNFRQAGFAPPAHGPSPVPPSGGPAGPFAMPGRAASPYKPVQLGNDLANLSLRRNSASTEGSSIPQSGSSSSLGPPRGRGDSLPHNQVSPAGSSSRPGTSPASPTPGVGAQERKTASPSPAATVGDSQSISPTSARRPPPGSLGPMPPSIFASMPQNAQLPNPPAAAAAAVAAGYALDKESAGSSRHTTSPYSNSGPTSRRGSSTLHDGTVHPGNQVRQQQGINLDSDTSISLLAGAENGQMQVPGNFAGGLASFYQQQQRGGGQNHSQAGMYGSGRSSPAPAFADRQLFVGNIPFNCQWQDLKDLFRAAGQIQRADVSLGPDGRSRGFGRVVFATPEDAMNAMQMFNGYEFQGRPLKVHFDKFAPGGSPFGQHAILSMPQYNGGPGAVYNGVYQSQFIQPSNAQNNQQADSGFQSVNRPSALQPLYGYAQNGQAWSQVGGGSFDDNSSVPGTPIHEMNLAQIAAFPSPGFASPMQQVQQQGQTAEMRRRGINAEGVPVAPIGSGAPHTQHDNRSLIQSGHGIPLSPLTIPPMSMAMPSPGPGGLFSPPLPGMGPMMTPSSKFTRLDESMKLSDPIQRQCPDSPSIPSLRHLHCCPNSCRQASDLFLLLLVLRAHFLATMVLLRFATPLLEVCVTFNTRIQAQG